MQNEMSVLIEEIRNLQKINKELEFKIDSLTFTTKTLENNVNITNNELISHIGFINKVFDIIKGPLFFVSNKVSNLMITDNNNNNKDNIDEKYYKCIEDEDEMFVG